MVVKWPGFAAGSLELRPLEGAEWPGSGGFYRAVWTLPLHENLFLFLRETWDFIFTCLLEIVLELLDWNA